MRRRDKTTGKAAKTQRPKTLKRRNAPKIVPRRCSVAIAKKPSAQVRRERDEALEWQEATGEILSSIDASTTDPGPVFDAIVRNLIRLFGTKFAVVTLIRTANLNSLEFEVSEGSKNWLRTIRFL